MIPLMRYLVKLIKTEMVVAKGWRETEVRSYYSMGIEFRSCKMKKF